MHGIPQAIASTMVLGRLSCKEGVTYKSSKDLANGIHWALTEGEYESLSEEACRKAVSSYSESTIAKKYVEIYNKITGNHA